MMLVFPGPVALNGLGQPEDALAAALDGTESETPALEETTHQE